MALLLWELQAKRLKREGAEIVVFWVTSVLDLSSKLSSWISSSARVLKEASRAPARVPVAKRGEEWLGGDHATAAVRFTPFNDIWLGTMRAGPPNLCSEKKINLPFSFLHFQSRVPLSVYESWLGLGSNFYCK